MRMPCRVIKQLDIYKRKSYTSYKAFNVGYYLYMKHKSNNI